MSRYWPTGWSRRWPPGRPFEETSGEIDREWEEWDEMMERGHGRRTLSRAAARQRTFSGQEVLSPAREEKPASEPQNRPGGEA